MPNTNDQQTQRMAHGTTGFTLVNEDTGETNKVIIKNSKFQVYKNDGTLLFQGGLRDSDGDGAVDMAKPGQALT